MKLSTHFSLGEAACRCGRTTCTRTAAGIFASPALLKTTKKQAQFLEKVRTALGGKTMHVNSWWRCKAHNTRVGGAKFSQHLDGTATDFTLRDKLPSAVQNVLDDFLIGKEGGFIGGLGRYDGFSHVDRRDVDTGVTWSG